MPTAPTTYEAYKSMLAALEAGTASPELQQQAAAYITQMVDVAYGGSPERQAAWRASNLAPSRRA